MRTGVLQNRETNKANDQTGILIWVSVAEATESILVPLLAAAVTILRGSRITLREVLNNYGVSNKSFGQECLESLLSRLHLFSEPLAIKRDRGGHADA